MRRYWYGLCAGAIGAAALLVAVEVVAFRLGLFWLLSPEFGSDSEAEQARELFAIARDLDAPAPAIAPVLLVGSSVLIAGIDTAALNAELRETGIHVLRLAVVGANAAETAVMAAAALRLHPWLVIYAATTRDFPKTFAADTQIFRVFYDSSIDLPAAPRPRLAAKLDAYLKRVWTMYRYRLLVRRMVVSGATPVRRWLGRRDEIVRSPPVPPEAYAVFPAWAASARAWTAWQHWRRTGDFADYLAWSPSRDQLLTTYKGQTMARFGPAQNHSAESFEWMITLLAGAGVRTAVLFFPENPVFREPDAAPYFDPALSRVYADFLADTASRHGAVYHDWRDRLAATEFYDMIHPNKAGQRKLTAELAVLIRQERSAIAGSH